MTTIYAESADTGRKRVETATVGVLIALSASHMLNDVMQSLAPALYPVFRQEFALSFFQVGLITFVFQLTASFLQPVIGLSLDKRPLNWILPVGMAFTLVGLVLLAFASSYLLILLSVAVVGIGSAVFHPEASRVARAASGGRHGFAQSLFQVGGNFGQSLGPLLAAFIVVPFGQHSVLVFTLLALAAVIILTGVSRWYAAVSRPSARGNRGGGSGAPAQGRGPHPVRAGGDAVLEGALPREPQQLLHLLPDPDLWRVRSRPRRCCCSCFLPRSPRALSSVDRWSTVLARSS